MRGKRLRTNRGKVSDMLTAIYGEVDVERGLREQGVGDSSVTFGCSTFSYDEPLIVLPEGWESMGRQELRDWSINYLVREGRVETPSPKSGQGCPKGDWAGYEAPVSLRTPGACPVCRDEMVEDDEYESGMRCEDCGYGDIDSHEYINLFATDAEVIDRQPGDGWFLGSRPGGTAMYSTDEFAASRVTYHEGEPLMTEVPAIEWDAYPSGWDVPVAVMGGTTAYEPSRLKGVENAYITR